MKSLIMLLVIFTLLGISNASDGTGTVGGVQKKPDLSTPKDPKPTKPKPN